MNNITIELCAEDRARLDRIAALLEAQTKAEVKEAQTTQEVKTAPKPEIKGTETQKEAPKALEQAPLGTMAEPELEPVTDEELAEAFDAAYGQEAEKVPEVKLADIQRLVVELATSGKKEKAREIVTSYAQSVTALPAEKYGEVYAKLAKLKELGV